MTPQRVVVPKSMLAEARQSELRLRKEEPLLWWLTLAGPFVITLVVLVALYFVYGGAFLQKLLGTAMATVVFFGRFIILGGRDLSEPSGNGAFLSQEALVLMVFYMDLMVATLIVFHPGFLFKLPWLGGRLALLAGESRAALQANPWFRRAAFTATAIFVMLPLASTGSVGGGVLTRICGMSRRNSMLAIMLGSLLGCGSMYLGAGLIDRYLDRDSVSLQVGGIAIVVLLIVLLNLMYRRLVVVPANET